MVLVQEQNETEPNHVSSLNTLVRIWRKLCLLAYHWSNSVWMVEHKSVNTCSLQESMAQVGREQRTEQLIHSTIILPLWPKHLLSLSAIKPILSERCQVPHPIIVIRLKIWSWWSASGQDAVLLDPTSVSWKIRYCFFISHTRTHDTCSHHRTVKQ